MTKIWLVLCVTILFLGLTGIVKAVPLTFDSNNDSVLDSDWIVSFDKVIDWEYNITSTSLTVTDVIPDPAYVDNYHHWHYVNLTRSVSLTDEFDIDFGVSWDEQTVASTGSVRLWLLDDNGDLITRNGIGGGNISMTGGRFAHVYGDDGSVDSYNTRENGIPLVGNGVFSITRDSNASLAMSWNDNPLVSNTNSSEIAKIQLQFSFNPYYNYAYFPTYSVDSLDVEPSQPIPEPTTILLMGFGLLGVLAFVIRQRRKVK